MSKGFTLIELLVVVSIMGLLGTASVGGYRQMQRGMEERGALDNASQFVAMASQRAQVDRQPVAVYFWNELLRSDEDDDLQTKIVVGKALAIRSCGRISYKSGRGIFDEYGNLEQLDEAGEYLEPDQEAKATTIYLMDVNEGTVKRSEVVDVVEHEPEEFLLTNPAGDNSQVFDTTTLEKGKGEIVRYGWRIKGGESSGWKVGSIYGMEFQELTLPHGYVFGSSGDVPSSMNNPTKEVGVIFFDGESKNTGSVRGKSSVLVSSLRPGSGGGLSVQSVGNTKVPDSEAKQ